MQAPPKQTSSFSEATRVSEQKKKRVSGLRSISGSDCANRALRVKATVKSSQLKVDRIAIELGWFPPFTLPPNIAN